MTFKINFSKNNYESLLDELALKSLSKKEIDSVIVKYSDLEKSLLKKPKTTLKEIQKKEETKIIETMNQVYFHGGRSESKWTNYQKQYASKYVLTLLDGNYQNPQTRNVKSINRKPEENLHFAIHSFLDFIDEGRVGFYYPQSIISKSNMKVYQKKLLNLLKKLHSQKNFILMNYI